MNHEYSYNYYVSSIEEASWVLKSYPAQSHKLIKPQKNKYRSDFERFDFYEVAPKITNLVIEVPNIAVEPDVCFLDVNNEEAYRTQLMKWIFWYVLLPNRQQLKLSDKAKTICSTYMNISIKPASMGGFFLPEEYRIADISDRPFDLHNPGTQHHAYKSAELCLNDKMAFLGSYNCSAWAGYELMRMGHLAPDMTYEKHDFLACVIRVEKDLADFNAEVEKHLTPYFPKFWPSGSDPKSYPHKAPPDIPRYAITRNEFLSAIQVK